MTADQNSDDQPSTAEPGGRTSEAVVSVREVLAPKRGTGGPSTTGGKAISSRNSTKHGILSRCPIVGDEKMEDWEAHLAGMYESFDPVGHAEEIDVYNLAHNRWLKSRLDGWRAETLRQQIDRATCWSPEEAEAARNGLPEDEALWVDIDAQAVLEAIDALAGSDDPTVSAQVAAGVVLALDLSCADTDAPSGSEPQPGEHDGGAADVVSRLRRCIEEVTNRRSLSIEVVLADARAEADDAALFQANRQERDRITRAMSISKAYVLDDHDAALDLRYGSQLEREYDRTLKQLETRQLTRQKMLPPPIRVAVDHDVT